MTWWICRYCCWTDCSLVLFCIWVLINTDTFEKALCSPEICSYVFLTSSVLLDQKTVAFCASKSTHDYKIYNLKYCHDSHKIDRCFIVKVKKDRFTQNRSPRLVLCLNLSSVQKFSGFEINELPLIVGFCFSMSLLLLSKWGLSRVVSCDYGRNTHVHVRPVLKPVKILQDIKKTATCKLVLC